MRVITIQNNIQYPWILLTGCLHGNEPISELVLMDFAKMVLENSPGKSPSNHSLDRYNYHIVPRVSDKYTRHEGHLDPNREFPNTPCTIELANNLRPQYHLHIDCHETVYGEVDEDNGFYFYYTPGQDHYAMKIYNDLSVNKHIDFNRSKAMRPAFPGKSDLAFDEFTNRYLKTKCSFTLETHTNQRVPVRYNQMYEAILSILKHYLDE